MKRLNTIILFAALLGFASQAQARVFAVRMPAILPTSPMIIKSGISLPTSQIPSINIPNIVPTIGDLPLPVIPSPALPLEMTAALAAPQPAAPATFHAARIHAVAVPLVQADTNPSGASQTRDTVENRLRTRRLVEFVRETLELDDETTLEDLESAFDGRADEDAENDRSGTVVLPERELEEELGLR